MKIYTDTPEGFTVIQNAFIDQYMPHANGEFVKVYLYLLRCANTGRDLSLSSIADVFEHTEKDIQRALIYWEKQQLLRIQMSPNGTLTALTFLEVKPLGENNAPHSPRTATEILEQGADPVSHKNRNTGSASALPKYQPGSGQISGSLPKYQANAGSGTLPGYTKKTEQNSDSAGDLNSAARQQRDLKQLFFIAEQYLQRPLTTSEQTDFIYYYDELHFSADLIEYLLEYCISKGSASRHYMKKVALSWAEAGITTVMQAKQETNLFNKNYFTIFNAFGIKGRNPAPAEQEVMSRWLNEFKFPMEIILEACTRTISQTHQPSFQYADRILSKWHKSGVKSLNDIRSLDAQRIQEQKKQPPQQPQKNTQNRFNNFSQREYDYNQLERQLLNQ